jgi:hypothetical protein
LLGSGLEIIGADSNILKVAMTINQTKPLTCETYFYYDVLTATPTANIYYLQGKITIKHTGHDEYCNDNYR